MKGIGTDVQVPAHSLTGASVDGLDRVGPKTIFSDVRHSRRHALSRRSDMYPIWYSMTMVVLSIVVLFFMIVKLKIHPFITMTVVAVGLALAMACRSSIRKQASSP